MLPLNAIEKEMQKVCEDYMKGGEKMRIIIAQMVKDNVPPYKDEGGIIPSVIYSNHPRFQLGCRFDYGFLQVALREGYNVLLLQK